MPKPLFHIAVLIECRKCDLDQPVPSVAPKKEGYVPLHLLLNTQERSHLLYFRLKLVFFEMPIYEFYCPECHAIYSFLSRRINIKKTPACPKCGKRKLKKQLSAFSFTGKAKEESPYNNLPIDESKMERAIGMLAAESGKIDENDPKQAANLMRKLSKMTGMDLGGSMEDALARLESGEDPEKIEKELGPDLDENPLFSPENRKIKRRMMPPRQDETLYEM